MFSISCETRIGRGLEEFRNCGDKSQQGIYFTVHDIIHTSQRTTCISQKAIENTEKEYVQIVQQSNHLRECRNR